MSTALGILKDEPKTLYIYECLDEEVGIGLLWSEKSDLDPTKYKFIHTYRRAFIGDMQEKLNRAHGTNLMEQYATQENVVNLIEQCNRQKNLCIEKNTKQNIFKQFHEYILSFFRKNNSKNIESPQDLIDFLKS